MREEVGGHAIARESGNIKWLMQMLIERKVAGEFVVLWAEQIELAGLHSKITNICRCEISRITTQICSTGEGRGSGLQGGEISRTPPWMTGRKYGDCRTPARSCQKNDNCRRPTSLNTVKKTAEGSPPETFKPLHLPPKPCNNRRDFLLHLEAYLARRDGVDKLLKISRYASKIAISSSLCSETLESRLKAFESSVGLSRKAFRLGKFVQDVNELRAVAGRPTYPFDIILSLFAYGGEGVYYFLEQIVWLCKAGVLSPELARRCQKISAWAELIGYAGSIALKVKEVRKLRTAIEAWRSAESKYRDDVELRKLWGKLLLKQLSLVQDLADVFMVLGDVMDGKGFLTDPLLMASAGMLSALISTHKNWISC